jgi:hypothetical protein
MALGKKGFLVAEPNAGGERAADIYSLILSAKPNGLDPELCVHHVLAKIVDHTISKTNERLTGNLSHPATIRNKIVATLASNIVQRIGQASLNTQDLGWARRFSTSITMDGPTSLLAMDRSTRRSMQPTSVLTI